MLIHCPSLTPVQSRLTASCLSLVLLGAIYWALSHTQFAYAIEVLGEAREGIETAVLEDDLRIPADGQHSLLVQRADALLIDANNSPNRGNLSPGQSNVWHYAANLLQGAFANQSMALPSNLSDTKQVIESKHIDLRKREDAELEARQISARIVYISINTCSQPTWSGPGEQQDAPPQLVMYIGQSGSSSVGPGASTTQTQLTLVGGFTQYTLSSSADVYVAVNAPSLPRGFTGSWTYDIAMSIDGYYHNSNTSSAFLYLVDSDVNSTLLVTDDLTLAPANSTVYQQWMSLSTLPFAVFANKDDNNKRWGLEQSFCGLQTVAEVSSLQNKTGSPYTIASMVTRGLKNGPKQQFFISNLTNSTTYGVSLALVGNGVSSGKGVVGGGGTVWMPTSYTTKSDGNCQLLYDLDFCSDVAYAVPSNSQYTTNALKTLYDNYTTQLYQNFTYSLMQVQCNTSNDQKYSLARDCEDCAAAYKQWLCAVTLPRCEDFSKNQTYLYPRNVAQAFFQNGSMLTDDILMQQYQPMPGAPTLQGSPIQQTWLYSYATNQSRNPALIDDVIKPGPYKEILPCEDICFDIVQSCPAALQFSCPNPGRGLEAGYAPRSQNRSVIECNYLGAVYYVDDARQLVPSMLLLFAIATMVILAAV